MVNRELYLIALNIFYSFWRTDYEMYFNDEKYDWKLRVAFVLTLIPRIYNLIVFWYMSHHKMLYGTPKTYLSIRIMGVLGLVTAIICFVLFSYSIPSGFELRNIENTEWNPICWFFIVQSSGQSIVDFINCIVHTTCRGVNGISFDDIDKI